MDKFTKYMKLQTHQVTRLEALHEAKTQAPVYNAHKDMPDGSRIHAHASSSEDRYSGVSSSNHNGLIKFHRDDLAHHVDTMRNKVKSSQHLADHLNSHEGTSDWKASDQEDNQHWFSKLSKEKKAEYFKIHSHSKENINEAKRSWHERQLADMSDEQKKVRHVAIKHGYTEENHSGRYYSYTKPETTPEKNLDRIVHDRLSDRISHDVSRDDTPRWSSYHVRTADALEGKLNNK